MPAPPAALSLTSRDAEEQASRFGLLEQRYEQLSRGPFSGSLLCLDLGPVTLFRETLEQSVHQTGVAPRDSLTVAAACELSDDAYWNGRHIGCDAIIAFAPGREFELRSPRRAVCVGVSIACDPAGNTAASGAGRWSGLRLGHDAWSDAGAARQRLSERLSGVLGLLSQASWLPAESAAWTQLAEELIADLALRLDAGEPERRLRESSYPRIARQAREYMLERIDEHLGIEALCEAVGCSRRALQYAFDSVFGVNPLAYLRALRLNAVRRELRRPQPHTTVQDAAARRGFWHFPRFAQEYAKMYGELPSRTLAEARRAGGLAGPRA